ncbi:SdpA family antimicrobial peptide system protein [Kitasatospora sp. LaBMicrA B282]|uniref:SdpA family antimicrobial peptide system protein n=1 Tax=Kitasatospora sp. LaBMicrA B282 TaxID=3420949 RepID=UPI003D14F98F
MQRLTSAQGFWFTAATLFLLLVASASNYLPAWAVPSGMQSSRTAIGTFWPQGWGFFAHEPTASVYVAYRVEANGNISRIDERQFSGKNYWGLSNSSLAHFVELGEVATRVPSEDWLQCGADTPVVCKSHAVRSTILEIDLASSNRTLCGHVVLAMESPLRWTADARAWMNDWRVIEVVNLEITCAR